MRLVALAFAALAIAGCTGTTTTSNASTPAPATSTESSTPTPEPSTPEPETPSPTTSEPSEQEPTPCEDVMFQRAQNTIRNQQSAFADRNFEAARGFASKTFRSSVSTEQFQQIIDGQYAFLLDSPEVTFVDCRRMGDFAYLQVDVAGSPTVTMAYRVVLEGESWFIDAAVVAGSREDVSA